MPSAYSAAIGLQRYNKQKGDGCNGEIRLGTLGMKVHRIQPTVHGLRTSPLIQPRDLSRGN